MGHSGRLAEVGSLETNRGERKLGREDPVNQKLSKNVQNGTKVMLMRPDNGLTNSVDLCNSWCFSAQLSPPAGKHPDDHEVGKKTENRGSSSIGGEISELSGNSAGLSLYGEQPEESEGEMGGNLFVPQSPPRLVVPSEKSSSDSEEAEIDFLAQHRLQFLALLEAISMRNFSSTDWELFMAYKVGDVNIEQIANFS